MKNNFNTPTIIDTLSIIPQKQIFKGKIVFLAQSSSISQCETWLDPLKFYRIATIIGDTSGGTNGDINGLSLKGGFYIPFTSRRVIKIDGTLLQGKGIEPDIQVKLTVKGIREGKDEIFERAIEYIEKGE